MEAINLSDKPFKTLKCKDDPLSVWISPKKPSKKFYQKVVDELLDKCLAKFPDARVLIISPSFQKDAGLPKYQYRNLRIKSDKNCPALTIYLKK